MSNAARNLEEAARLLENGWVQRAGVARYNNRTCMCLSFALTHASGGGACWDERDALAKVIGTRDLVCWNDAPFRTQGEVVDACRKAAAIVREQAGLPL